MDNRAHSSPPIAHALSLSGYSFPNNPNAHSSPSPAKVDRSPVMAEEDRLSAQFTQVSGGDQSERGSHCADDHRDHPSDHDAPCDEYEEDGRADSESRASVSGFPQLLPPSQAFAPPSHAHEFTHLTRHAEGETSRLGGHRASVYADYEEPHYYHPPPLASDYHQPPAHASQALASARASASVYPPAYQHLPFGHHGRTIYNLQPQGHLSEPPRPQTHEAPLESPTWLTEQKHTRNEVYYQEPTTHRDLYSNAHHRPPYPASPPQQRIQSSGAHVYTPYAAPGMPPRPSGRHVGASEGWGPPPQDEQQAHYQPYPFPDEDYHAQSGGSGGPSVVNPAYVNPNAYIERAPDHYHPQLANRYEAYGSPPRMATYLAPLNPAPASKERKASGPPKARVASTIYHPTPQAMLAPHLQGALAPRKPNDNTPYVASNAPALPSADKFKSMITKRSRGRRPPGVPDLVLSDDPNANPSPEHIRYVGLTKTGKPKKIFVCEVPECKRVFKRSEHLKRHLRSIHSTDRPFQCRWPGCQRYFSRHDNLNQHLRVHRVPGQSDDSFSAALEACFGSKPSIQSLGLSQEHSDAEGIFEAQSPLVEDEDDGQSDFEQN